MDPNANLQEQEAILIRRKTEHHLPRNHAAVRLEELRQALRHWLNDGGFEPNWESAPLATRAFKQWRPLQRWLDNHPQHR